MHAERIHLSPTTAVSALAAAGLVIFLVHAFLTSNTLRSMSIQTVSLVSSAPPPPPPEVQKPVEEKVEKLEYTKMLDASEWTPGEASATAGPGTGGLPNDGVLGLDEAGAGGGDAFGLAGKPGGHELLLTGPPGGGNPQARFLQYANEIQASIQARLKRVAALTQDCYAANVGIWVGSTGSIEDVKIIKSSGDRKIDAEIRNALLELAPLTPSPPSDMPWPVRLQVNAHRPDCNP